jgi:hypothetical protein
MKILLIIYDPEHPTFEEVCGALDMGLDGYLLEGYTFKDVSNINTLIDHVMNQISNTPMEPELHYRIIEQLEEINTVCKSSPESDICPGNYVAYNAQGIANDTVYICTLCGKGEAECKILQEPNTSK